MWPALLQRCVFSSSCQQQASGAKCAWTHRCLSTWRLWLALWQAVAAQPAAPRCATWCPTAAAHAVQHGCALLCRFHGTWHCVNFAAQRYTSHTSGHTIRVAQRHHRFRRQQCMRMLRKRGCMYNPVRSYNALLLPWDWIGTLRSQTCKMSSQLQYGLVPCKRTCGHPASHCHRERPSQAGGCWLVSLQCARTSSVGAHTTHTRNTNNCPQSSDFKFAKRPLTPCRDGAQHSAWKPHRQAQHSQRDAVQCPSRPHTNT